MKSLAHKVALITGVTRHQGIGAAIAFALAQAGADVCTAYYRPYDRRIPWGVEDTEPEEILMALRQTGVQAQGFEIDLGQVDGPRILCKLARERFGRTRSLDRVFGKRIIVVGGGAQVALVAHDADGHPPGMDVAPAVTRVLGGGESPGGLRRVRA